MGAVILISKLRWREDVESKVVGWMIEINETKRKTYIAMKQMPTRDINGRRIRYIYWIMRSDLVNG